MSLEDYLQKLCYTDGACLIGHYNASKKMLPNVRKLPIYLSAYNDFLIPLGTNKKGKLWFSANNFLTCVEHNNSCYIKFKDKSEIRVPYSRYTVMVQYRKALTLAIKIEELRSKVFRLFDIYRG